jgi:hypothetical protein
MAVIGIRSIAKSSFNLLNWWTHTAVTHAKTFSAMLQGRAVTSG